MKIIKNNSGISILEVIVAIMIITMGMVGVLSLVVQNVQAQYINKNVLMAAGLAQEGLELVRNIRDLNWLTPGNDWDKDIVGAGADYTYTIDYNGPVINTTVNSLNDASARLYVNSNGFYTHTVTASSTNFYRLITVAVVPIDATHDYLDVKCTIRWKDGGVNHDYTAETYLYNWK
ncbi:MAG: type II secretion system protein [Patescibacteria group bacterium]|jgi:type II secretory pathway pseudopilin PulG